MKNQRILNYAIKELKFSLVAPELPNLIYKDLANSEGVHVIPNTGVHSMCVYLNNLNTAKKLVNIKTISIAATSTSENYLKQIYNQEYNISNLGVPFISLLGVSERLPYTTPISNPLNFYGPNNYDVVILYIPPDNAVSFKNSLDFKNIVISNPQTIFVVVI